MDTDQRNKWFADDAEDDGGLHIDPYDITASPNDFNLVTLCSFIDRGAIKIPGFQRHFVWDLTRASRLIESLILGLPVPQLFLYEESRNSFLGLRLAGRGEKIHEKVCRYGGRVPIREVWRARAMTAAVRRVLGLSETLGTCASSASNETRRS